MTKEELLELLDIEHGSELTYYENIAELLEGEREIGPEAIAEVLMEADLSTFAEIAESYFYDIMERMPDDVDVYNILESVKRNIVSLAEAEQIPQLAEHLDEFHRYYALTDNCEVVDRERGTAELKPLRDVISDNRLAIMDNRELEFDLEGAKDFVVEEYIVGIGDLMGDDMAGDEDGSDSYYS